MALVRPIRFTAAEAAALRVAAGQPDVCGVGLPHRVSLASAIQKLDDAGRPAPAGVAAGPLEVALIATSRGKVVQLAGSGLYGRVSKVATAAGATQEDARLIGSWLARQGWLKEPITIVTVVNKWAEWLPRARATAAPAGTKEGLGGHMGPGTEAKRPGPSGGRRPPGLG